MDSPTYSSSIATSNNREGSSSAAVANDEGALSVISGLAKEAALLFQSGKFLDCIRVLLQLQQKKAGDPKVLHNIAIAKSFQDEHSDPKSLIEELNEVKRFCNDHAGADGDHSEATGNVGRKSAAGVKGNNIMSNQYSTLHSSPVLIDEFDTSMTVYNLAVSWFHLHEYAKAFSTLDALFQNIEPLDADVISYMEKVFCNNILVNQVENGNSAQQPSPILAESVSLTSNSILDASNSESPPTAINSEDSLARTLSDEGLEDELHLISSIEMSRKNPPKQSGIQQSSNIIMKNQVVGSISTIDMRVKLLLCKVRFLILTRNLKAAKREVKMAMKSAHGKDYSLALYLKSQLEYARGNHRKAIKLLMASSNRTEVGMSSMYYNNLGCIYHQFGKHHTSAVFYSKALSSCSSLRKEKPLKLSIISQDKSLLIVYNSGVQYLTCRKPLQAAQCFYKASVIFYNKPLLWLRIAECCIMAFEKGLITYDSLVSSNKSEVMVHVVGKGKWRHLVIEDGLSRIRQENSVGREDLAFGDRQPIPSLSLARQCLLNALHLLNCSESKHGVSSLSNATVTEDQLGGAVSSKVASHNIVAMSGQVNENGEVKEHKGENSQNTSLLSFISDYDDICRKENHMIKQAVLVDLAYVELELGDPLRALSAARYLLKLPGCSRIYMFLGNLYAAEALCLLSRPKEAVEHLSRYVSGGKGIDIPYSQEDLESWQVKTQDEESNGGSGSVNSLSPDGSQWLVFIKPEEARGILFANLAAVSAVQGSLELAKEFAVQALSIMPKRPEAILTAVYVDLLRGNTQEALTKLKLCSSVRFLPSNLVMTGSL
ncbi:PREDICTED: CCR4-NOT transcription complex subunit 10-like isoform X2 [Ipomoea nil]|uniref:CCR4-NOT transcription complex subunit 10-like isoform X2 n=1 Tax=Ipomoea nil TaxID=35883 RepID=UPI0009009902|nr:PREDICTED: CCR4-NOT transcription complex subunit 10-like isoform X2 [Ipomoea nil]